MRITKAHLLMVAVSAIVFSGGCKWDSSKPPPPKTETSTSDRWGKRTHITFFGDGTTIRTKTTDYEPEEGSTIAMDSETFRQDGTLEQSVRKFRRAPFSREFKPPMYRREERAYDSSGNVELEVRRYDWSSEQLIEVTRELARGFRMSLRFREDGSRQQMMMLCPDSSTTTIFFLKDGATIHKEWDSKTRIVTYKIAGRGEYRELSRESVGGRATTDNQKQRPYLIDTYKGNNGKKLFEQTWYERLSSPVHQLDLGEVKVFAADGSIQKRIRLYRLTEQPSENASFVIKEVEVPIENGKIIRSYGEDGLLTSQTTYNRFGKPVKEELNKTVDEEGLVAELFRQILPLDADEKEW